MAAISSVPDRAGGARAPTSDSLKVDRALAIAGWMFPLEVLWLAFEARTRYKIVELGSFLGRSTRALADNTPGWVLAVDDFEGPRDTAASEVTSLDAFRLNLKGVLSKVRICQSDFAEVNPQDHEPPFDMIFIDGCHDYLSVRRDIDKWLPYLAGGGIICGHDFQAEYPEVQQAVLEKFTHHVQIVPGSSIWCVNP